jgi:hypothetical protein
LQRHGMFARVEANQSLARAEHDRVRVHHLGIEPGAAREDAMERPATPVGPVHHRRNAKSKFLIWLHFLCNLNSLGRVVCTLFYAMMRPFTRQFDGSVHTERTRFGDVLQAQFRVLASPGAAERKICQ